MDREMSKPKIIDDKIYAQGNVSWWSTRRGICVHNDSCLQQDSDSETEDRIARAIEQAYQEGYERGFQRGAETIAEKLGA